MIKDIKTILIFVFAKFMIHKNQKYFFMYKINNIEI